MDEHVPTAGELALRREAVWWYRALIASIAVYLGLGGLLALGVAVSLVGYGEVLPAVLMLLIIGALHLVMKFASKRCHAAIDALRYMLDGEDASGAKEGDES